MYTAVARRCIRSVYAVNGSVHGHIHGTYTAVHTGRKHGRLHGRKHGRVHGHGRTMYMARARPCAQSVHGHGRPCTDCARPPSAMYKLAMHMVRPCPEHGRVRSRYVAKHGRYAALPDRVRTVYMAVHGPCTEYTAVYVYTAVFTARVHGRVRTMYTAVHGPSTTRTWPCTRSCTLYTAVFTTRVHGRVPCTCTCLWPVYTAVHCRVQTAYGPCSLHGPFMTRTRRRFPYGRVYSPCRVHGRSRRVRTVYTTTRTVHSRYRKS